MSRGGSCRPSISICRSSEICCRPDGLYCFAMLRDPMRMDFHAWSVLFCMGCVLFAMSVCVGFVFVLG